MWWNESPLPFSLPSIPSPPTATHHPRSDFKIANTISNLRSDFEPAERLVWRSDWYGGAEVWSDRPNTPSPPCEAVDTAKRLVRRG